jgi:hypothetical protein
MRFKNLRMIFLSTSFSGAIHDGGTRSIQFTDAPSSERGARWPLSAGVIMWGLALLMLRPIQFKPFRFILISRVTPFLAPDFHRKYLLSIFKAIFMSPMGKQFAYTVNLANGFDFRGFHFILLGLCFSLFLLINIIKSNAIVNRFLQLFVE